MKVKNIIKKVCNLANLLDLYDAIVANVFTEEQQQEINLLVDCVNLTNSNIATNYEKLYAETAVDNTSGVISYVSVSANTIFDIVSVKNVYGESQKFSLTTSGVVTHKGKVTIRYTYFPEDVVYAGDITNYPIKIQERVFVYGVLSEYLYAVGQYEDAKMWEDRFKTELKSSIRVQKSIKLKKNRWC